jgi:hypothetical protein
MEFNANHAKGILDKSYPSVKVPLHKDITSTILLKKCQEVVWGKSPANYTYFMADGSGSAIGSDSFDIEHPNGLKEILPWTLTNYLKVSNIKYPSRLRLYCVRKLSSKFVVAGGL